MWTYNTSYNSETNQLIKEVIVCPRVYCTMDSAFTAIDTSARSIGIEQLSSPLKKIRFLCGAPVARVGKMSDEVAKFVGSMLCRSGENKSISSWTFPGCFVAGALLSGRSPSALQIRVSLTPNPSKGMLWSCPAI